MFNFYRARYRILSLSYSITRDNIFALKRNVCYFVMRVRRNKSKFNEEKKIEGIKKEYFSLETVAVRLCNVNLKLPSCQLERDSNGKSKLAFFSVKHRDKATNVTNASWTMRNKMKMDYANTMYRQIFNDHDDCPHSSTNEISGR